jgi:hypothetical protein
MADMVLMQGCLALPISSLRLIQHDLALSLSMPAQVTTVNDARLTVAYVHAV